MPIAAQTVRWITLNGLSGFWGPFLSDVGYHEAGVMRYKVAVVIDKDLEDLVPGFLENRETDIAKIQQALDVGDFEKIGRIAHDMKGMGGGYGFQEITDLGITMGEVSQQKDQERLQVLLDKYEYYLDNLVVNYD